MRLALVVLLGLLVKMFAFDVYPVREQSMWPAFRGGEDQIGVDKIAAWSPHPERFEMWVFRHKAEGKDQLFVKRLLGLPGEVIDFRGGDIWIGPTDKDLERAARFPGVVEAQRIRVPPGDAPLTFDAKAGRIDRDGDALVLTPDAAGGRAVARLIGGAGVEPYSIKDDHLNNAGRYVRGRHAVPDVRATLGPIAMARGGLFAVSHELGGGEHRRVVCDQDGITISARVDGEETIRSKHPGASCEKGLRIETLDGTFTVSLPEGAGWRTLFSEPRRTERSDSFSGLRFEASGGPVRIGSLEVTRDVHYVWGADSPATPKLIPPERLFMAGDNPEISIDSREDAFGLVGTSDVVGLVRLRVWPVGRIGIPK